MNKYKKGNSVIYATEKSYNTIYKVQGYIPCDEEEIIEDNPELETIKLENKSLNETIDKLTDEISILKDDLKKTKSKSKKDESEENE